MTWFKLDDQFHSQPKVIAAGNAAIGLYCRLGTYCADKLTDGFVADSVARSMGTTRELQRLTDCPIPDTRPLLTKVAGGFLLRDYLDYNPSRATVLADRAKAKERMDKVRGRSPEHQANNTRTRNRTSSVPVPVPVPLSSVPDNSTPENTRGAGDNLSRRDTVLNLYATAELEEAKRKGTTIRTEDGYRKAAWATGSNHPDLDRWLQERPTAPASAVASWIAGDTHSMAYYPAEELAEVIQLREGA